MAPGKQMKLSMEFQPKLPVTRQSFHHEYVSVMGSRWLEQLRQPVSIDRDFEVSKAMRMDKFADAA